MFRFGYMSYRPGLIRRAAFRRYRIPRYIDGQLIALVHYWSGRSHGSTEGDEF